MSQQTPPTGAALRVLRKIAGMTLEQAATAAGTSVAYLSKVETGRFVPSKGYVAQVTHALATHMQAETREAA